MNRFLAAYLRARRLTRELVIATDREDYKELRRERRKAQMELGATARELGFW
jgi:hypothetical protein